MSGTSAPGRAPDAAPPTCESCGARDDRLYPVRRQYITPAAWDTPERQLTLDEIEHWCFSCCTHYPHQPADPA